MNYPVPNHLIRYLNAYKTCVNLCQTFTRQNLTFPHILTIMNIANNFYFSLMSNQTPYSKKKNNDKSPWFETLEICLQPSTNSTVSNVLYRPITDPSDDRIFVVTNKNVDGYVKPPKNWKFEEEIRKHNEKDSKKLRKLTTADLEAIGVV
eukprot:NP_509207.1 Uncharacterized protein CELE_C55B6.4 [Caenorhabditis elegans]